MTWAPPPSRRLGAAAAAPNQSKQDKRINDLMSQVAHLKNKLASPSGGDQGQGNKKKKKKGGGRGVKKDNQAPKSAAAVGDAPELSHLISLLSGSEFQDQAKGQKLCTFSRSANPTRRSLEGNALEVRVAPSSTSARGSIAGVITERSPASARIITSDPVRLRRLGLPRARRDLRRRRARRRKQRVVPVALHLSADLV